MVKPFRLVWCEGLMEARFIALLGGREQGELRDTEDLAPNVLDVLLPLCRCQATGRHKMCDEGEGLSCEWNLKGAGGGGKYPSAVLVVPQLQFYDLGRKAVGLFLCITWGHSSEDQNALPYGRNQLLFHRDRRRKHSLEYGCE